MKIYTKTGDAGETGLIGGSRVPKDVLRVAAYGDVDELNALIGVVRSHPSDAEADALFQGLQQDLFALGAQLADPTARIAERKAKAALDAGRIEALERVIDACEGRMPELRAFLLPGGTARGALLHLARTVCRRAERTVVSLSRAETIDPQLIVYLNRLSDLLFVMARHENLQAGRREERW